MQKHYVHLRDTVKLFFSLEWKTLPLVTTWIELENSVLVKIKQNKKRTQNFTIVDNDT